MSRFKYFSTVAVLALLGGKNLWGSCDEPETHAALLQIAVFYVEPEDWTQGLDHVFNVARAKMLELNTGLSIVDMKLRLGFEVRDHVLDQVGTQTQLCVPIPIASKRNQVIFDVECKEGGE